MQDLEMNITVKETSIEDCIRQGFKMEWMSAEEDGQEYIMYSGAGCGSPWLQMKVGDKNYSLNMREFFEEVIAKAKEAGA